MSPFPFNDYKYPDFNGELYDNRYFRNAVLLENGAIYIGEWSNWIGRIDNWFKLIKID